jgi:hypothetical protein
MQDTNKRNCDRLSSNIGVTEEKYEQYHSALVEYWLIIESNFPRNEYTINIVVRLMGKIFSKSKVVNIRSNKAGLVLASQKKEYVDSPNQVNGD